MANTYLRVQPGNEATSFHEAPDSPSEGLYVAGTQVVGPQQAVVTAASTTADVGATFNQTNINAAINANGTKINAILTALKTHGLIASA